MALNIVQYWDTAGGREDLNLTIAPNPDNWLIAVITYRFWDGTLPLASIGDLARNWWTLCGSTYHQATTTRVEVWVCPRVQYAPWAMNVIYAAVSHLAADDVGSVALQVIEISGFTNGFVDVVSATPGSAGSATGLSVNLPAPGANSLVIAAAATSNAGLAVTPPGTGWGALSQVSRGAPDGPDLRLSVACRATSAAQTATWSTASAVGWTGLVVAIRETGTPWPQPNANWPATRLQLGHTVGLETPLTRVNWTNHTGRFEGLRAGRGVQYELGRPQAGEAQITLRNFDNGATPTPGGALDIYTPYQLLMAWQGKIYPVSAGWVERWRRRWVTPHHGYVDASGVDAIATLVATLPTPLRGEILRRRPYAYWPLSDPAGSPSALNVAGRSQAVATLARSKYGSGANGKAEFGASTDSDGHWQTRIYGDPGSGWQQSGLAGGDTDKGYALIAEDRAFPAISGGITICGMLRPDAAAPDGTLCILRNLDPGGGAGQGSVIKVWLSGMTVAVTVWDKDTHAATTTYSIQGFVVGDWSPWSLRLTRTSWRVTLQDPTLFVAGSADLVDGFDSISFGGEADAFWNGNSLNASHAHLAVYDRWLSDAELQELGVDARNAWADDEAVHQRAQRWLAITGSDVPRTLMFGDAQHSRDTASGGALAQTLGDMMETENGLVFADGAGYLRVMSQRFMHRQPVRWVLGDNTGAGEIPFQADAAPDYDLTHLYNSVTLNNDNEYAVTAIAPRTHIAADPDSISRYGARPLERNTSLYSPQAAWGLAEWLLAVHKTPRHRWEQVVVDAARYPAAWPLVLGVEVGDLITVVRRPLGQPAVTAQCRVMTVSHDITSGTGQTRASVALTLAPAPPQVLVLGDPVKGVLGNSTIGW